ncbi:MAG: hypothetical protein Q4C42_02380 [Clostridia bacterium]|nr:hypothetical protein [Clostridia bacterium]
MIKKIRLILSEKSGVTMANVLVAFFILMMVLAMYASAVRLSGRVFQRCDDMRKRTEILYSDFYTDSEQVPGATGTRLVFSGDNGTFSVDSSTGVYESRHGSVYYFGDRE